MPNAHLVELWILEGELASDPLVLIRGRHGNGAVVVLIQDLPNQQKKCEGKRPDFTDELIINLRTTAGYLRRLNNLKTIYWTHEKCVCLCVYLYNSVKANTHTTDLP